MGAHACAGQDDSWNGKAHGKPWSRLWFACAFPTSDEACAAGDGLGTDTGRPVSVIRRPSRHRRCLFVRVRVRCAVHVDTELCDIARMSRCHHTDVVGIDVQRVVRARVADASFHGQT